jgi:hypothetical protein
VQNKSANKLVPRKCAEKQIHMQADNCTEVHARYKVAYIQNASIQTAMQVDKDRTL